MNNSVPPGIYICNKLETHKSNDSHKSNELNELNESNELNDDRILNELNIQSEKDNINKNDYHCQNDRTIVYPKFNTYNYHKPNTSFKPYTNERKKKFRYHDNNGRQLTAAGIVFYDDTGIWCILEREKGRLVCSDIGGKYTFEDCDIYSTIARELREETYNCCELTHSQVVELSKTCECVYINGHTGLPVYLCLMVPVNKINFDFQNIPFIIQRNKALESNPMVPSEYYSSMDLIHVPFDKITLNKYHKKDEPFENRLNMSYNHGEPQLSHRLRRILQHSELVHKIPSLDPINTELDDTSSE